MLLINDLSQRTSWTWVEWRWWLIPIFLVLGKSWNHVVRHRSFLLVGCSLDYYSRIRNGRGSLRAFGARIFRNLQFYLLLYWVVVLKIAVGWLIWCIFMLYSRKWLRRRLHCSRIKHSRKLFICWTALKLGIPPAGEAWLEWTFICEYHSFTGGQAQLRVKSGMPHGRHVRLLL